MRFHYSSYSKSYDKGSKDLLRIVLPMDISAFAFRLHDMMAICKAPRSEWFSSTPTCWPSYGYQSTTVLPGRPLKASALAPMEKCLPFTNSKLLKIQIHGFGLGLKTAHIKSGRNVRAFCSLVGPPEFTLLHLTLSFPGSKYQQHL